MKHACFGHPLLISQLRSGFNLITLFLLFKVPQSELDIDVVKSILGEYRIHNADICLRCDATAEDLIDVVEGNRVYIPCIYLLNKIDQISIEVSECNTVMTTNYIII